MRWRTWLRRSAIALFSLWVGVVFGFLPYRLAGMAVNGRYMYPDNENEGLTPASFDLSYEDISFDTEDAVRLSGWWVPVEEAHGTVVLIHGLNRQRIEMVQKVPFLHEAGWNALLFDSRQHGESGGEVRSFGFYEQRDVRAALDWIRERSPGPTVLWGVSLGGATAAMTAAAEPDVGGLICDSSFRSLADTVRHHVRLFRGWNPALKLIPPWPTSEIALFWIGQRGGFDTDSVDVEAAVARLGDRPCLFVCNSDDRRMPSQIAFDLQRAAGPQAKVLVVPGKSHGGAYRAGTAQYQTAVQDVLAQVLTSEGRLIMARAAISSVGGEQSRARSRAGS
jgi:hypothetical protein